MRDLSDQELFRQQAYVDGAWVDADSADTLAVDDPATGEELGTVPLMGAEETRRAIEAANRAWPAWRKLTAKERAARLRRWCDLVLENRDDLALIMTRECGKPLTESKGEVAYAASFIEWFADEGRRVYGDLIPAPAGDKRIAVAKEPVGVSAAITPWNFPAAMITRKVAPALAAGCPAVVKPAEATPYTALALAELAHRADIPAGVFNVITGNPQAIGGELCANPIVRKLSFTGSTAVGRKLMAQCADTVKKISLELGGNAPFIVFDDADVEAAVQGAMDSKFRNSGQTCVCANRVMVQSGIYGEFTERLAEAMKAELRVGAGLENGVNQGPLINPAAVEKVERHVADATEKGARVLTGGARHELGGQFFQPTLLADVNTDMLLAREEIFGPVAPVFRFDTEDEAVAMANDTEYGLAAYFYSRDVARAWRVSEALEYGMVGINTGLLSAAEAPFGGMKASGLGREGSHYGIEEYLETKYLCFGGIA
ncbi:MAG: NAD-dependent succinate-semialdehyde dehydrogenase [Ectothiorhodospiraceae bacterium]|jgi:succinate-semialdehyde dehydrogenase/glutarate-semialdehyde dehydrogenase